MANPMLTVGTLRVHRKGVLPWLVCWARHASTIELCLALAPLVSPVKNIIFITSHFLTLLVSGLAVVLGRLSLRLCAYNSVRYYRIQTLLAGHWISAILHRAHSFEKAK